MSNGESKVAWYLSAVAVLFLLFCVMGPFALPMLYKSPCFSDLTKIILTILVLILTGVVLFHTYKALTGITGQMNQMEKILAY
ncbi:MAG: hypothetical protein HQ564_08500 [Candidatus Saganbacteria bacterium]|nr:hypothetical protein [Candidatus Saganbacteria bacterium]